MYVTMKHVIVGALAYGLIRAGVTIYKEQDQRIYNLEQSVRELKGR